jgi:glycerol-3-phosphate dehydrogenase
MKINRNRILNHIITDQNDVVWDIIVIGGGASGLGTALEASSRGYKTLLLERSDFASCTSSRSTKLIHGGVRYLEQGNINLVRDALEERAYLLSAIPEIVKPLGIILPTANCIAKSYYRIGIGLYDFLAGKKNVNQSYSLNKRDLIKLIPNIDSDKLRSGIMFYDAQFDDSRLAIQIMKSIYDYGGIALNYCSVTSIDSSAGQINITDNLSHKSFCLKAHSIINATGIFHDETCALDDKNSEKTLALSRGSHLVLSPKKFSQKNGLIIPKTSDGRVLFVLPWKKVILAGTTDIETETPIENPQITDQEKKFIIQNLESYYSIKVEEKDIITSFSGIRPLVKTDATQGSSKLSRDHIIRQNKNGLFSISGGKWTTFRKMGEDMINFLEKQNEKQTKSLKHSLKINREVNYWEEAEEFFSKECPSEANTQIAKEFIEHFKDYEMAQCAEDIFERRTRTALINPIQRENWSNCLEITDENL